MAQLVAHLHGMQGVRGSSPLRSTNDLPRLGGVFRYLDYLPPPTASGADPNRILWHLKVLCQHTDQSRIGLPFLWLCSKSDREPLWAFDYRVQRLIWFHQHANLHDSTIRNNCLSRGLD